MNDGGSDVPRSRFGAVGTQMTAEAALRTARSDPHRSFISTVESVETVETVEAFGELVSVPAGSARSGSRPTGSASSGNGLTGVPFAAKDNLDTRDLPTTANTPGLLRSVPARDNPVIRSLRRAGAVLVGKTNMHELALGITTNDAAFPATRNPADPARSAGGSSGGSAAAVADGTVPFALGTDTGGSITIPAAWCGVFGFRPSSGRWPGEGVVPLAPTRDTVGVLADSLARIAEVDSVVSGASGVSPGREGAGLTRTAPLRIGVPMDDSEFLAELAPGVRAVWERSLAGLDAAPDLELVRLETDGLHRLEQACGGEIEFYEISHALSQYLRGLAGGPSFAELRERVARTDVGELLDQSWACRDRSEQYRTALETRSRLQDLYRRTLDAHGVAGLLYPSCPITAPRIGEETWEGTGGSSQEVFAIGTRNVNPGSVAGQPVVTVPAGRDAEGLPIGISLEGRRHDDRGLLGVAARIARSL